MRRKILITILIALFITGCGNKEPYGIGSIEGMELLNIKVEHICYTGL